MWEVPGERSLRGMFSPASESEFWHVHFKCAAWEGTEEEHMQFLYAVAETHLEGEQLANAWWWVDKFRAFRLSRLTYCLSTYERFHDETERPPHAGQTRSAGLDFLRQRYMRDVPGQIWDADAASPRSWEDWRAEHPSASVLHFLELQNAEPAVIWSSVLGLSRMAKFLFREEPANAYLLNQWAEDLYRAGPPVAPPPAPALMAGGEEAAALDAGSTAALPPVDALAAVLAKVSLSDGGDAGWLRRTRARLS